MAHPVVALVEDDSATITVITDLLTTEGYQPFHWRQGSGAHALIKEQQPQAVILDIRLEHRRAESDVLDDLRNDPVTRAIPIIVCTGDEDFLQENKTRLREQRCAVVQKPFTLDHLLAEIKTMLDRTPGRARWNAAPRNGSAWHTALLPADGAPSAPVIALVDRKPAGHHAPDRAADEPRLRRLGVALGERHLRDCAARSARDGRDRDRAGGSPRGVDHPQPPAT